MSREFFERTGKLTKAPKSKYFNIGKTMFQFCWGRDVWSQMLDSGNMVSMYFSFDKLEEPSGFCIYRIVIWRFHLAFAR